LFKTDLETARSALAALIALGPPARVLPLLGPVKNKLDAYAKDFATLSGNMLKRDEQFDLHMRPAVEQLTNNVQTAQASLKQDFEATRTAEAEAIESTIMMQQVAAGLALLLGGLIGFLIGRGVIQPVAGMTTAMAKLAAGDTGVAIPSREATDEMGAMAKAVEVFRQSALDRLRLEKEQAEQGRRVVAEKRAAMLSLAEGFERSVGSIVGLVAGASSEMETTARSMAASAERATQQAGNVAAASTRASGNVQMVAAATEELSTSIGDINQQVVRSTQMALRAVEDARRTDDTVKGLASGAQKIGEVVSLGSVRI
jgi:methyl-accepting chemotaxis protein